MRDAMILLGVRDYATLRSWCEDAEPPISPVGIPGDKRPRYLTAEEVRRLARAHRRTLDQEALRAKSDDGQVRDLLRRVEALESAVDALQHAPRAPVPTVRLPYADLLPPAEPRPYHVRREPGGEETFRSHADAARWLLAHGINAPSTPKSWPGWMLVELTREAVLRFARANEDPLDWRKRAWRVRPCTEPSCVCHALLGGESAQEGG